MRQSMTYLMGAVVGVVVFSSVLFANAVQFTSMRSLGMGNAGVAITQDEHSLYRNPAGLARSGVSIKWPRVRAQMNNDFIDLD